MRHSWDEALDIQSIVYLQHIAAMDIVIQLWNADAVISLYAHGTLLVRASYQ